MSNSFATRDQLQSGGQSYEFYNLTKLNGRFPAVASLPFSLKILLENLQRH